MWLSGIEGVLAASREHRASLADRFCAWFISGASRSRAGKENRRVHSAARPPKLPVPYRGRGVG